MHASSGIWTHDPSVRAANTRAAAVIAWIRSSKYLNPHEIRYGKIKDSELNGNK
jgi:hypothetical protein